VGRRRQVGAGFGFAVHVEFQPLARELELALRSYHALDAGRDGGVAEL
jgi:hypothetical protein